MKSLAHDRGWLEQERTGKEGQPSPTECSAEPLPTGMLIPTDDMTRSPRQAGDMDDAQGEGSAARVALAGLHAPAGRRNSYCRTGTPRMRR